MGVPVTETLVWVLIVGLAAFRIARAIATDTVSLPFRRWLFAKAYAGIPPDQIETADPSMFQSAPVVRWLYKLLSCPFCIGFWISLALWAVLHEGRDPLVTAFAVAGFQYLLTRWSE